MNEDFNEYMTFFKEQPLKEKQNIIYEQLQLLSGLTNSLCKELGVKNEILMNRELLDLKKEDYTQDDFAEAIIVLINSIQNSICDYADGINNMLDVINGQSNN